jgi:hypothetical protein
MGIPPCLSTRPATSPPSPPPSTKPTSTPWSPPRTATTNSASPSANTQASAFGTDNPSASATTPAPPFAIEVNAIIPDSMNRHVDKTFHEHVHLEHLAPPPGYDDDPAVLQWVFCAPDAPGAVPITIGVFQTTDEDLEPE